MINAISLVALVLSLGVLVLPILLARVYTDGFGYKLMKFRNRLGIVMGSIGLFFVGIMFHLVLASALAGGEVPVDATRFGEHWFEIGMLLVVILFMVFVLSVYWKLYFMREGANKGVRLSDRVRDKVRGSPLYLFSIFGLFGVLMDADHLFAGWGRRTHLLALFLVGCVCVCSHARNFRLLHGGGLT